jgi:hypothetical protein
MAIAAVAGLASLGGAALAGFVTSFAVGLGYFALGAGLSMVSRALAPKPNLGAQMRGITQTTREPAGSRKIVYGKMRVGGQVVFISNSGDDNKYLHMAIAFASHEIESYEEIWFNDKKVWTLSGGFQSDWGTYVTIDRKFGTDAQAASTDLVNANVLWTTNHKLSGIAYIAFRLEWDADKFPQGVPNITAVLKGKKVYDPRTASTGWSQNPALCLRDYMLDDKYGLGEVTANIDSTAINAAANLCEEQVTLDAGGTQDRYQCNGVIETGNQIRANIEQLLASMGGMLTYSGGKYFIDGAEYKAPALTFTEADVISDIQTQTKQSRRGVYNGVKGIFVSEEKNYKVLDYPPQISSTYATEDGDPIYLDMALPFVTNNTQAQRLAKIALLKSRQQVVINMTVNLKGLQVKIGDTINVTNDRLSYSSKVFQVIDYSLAIADGGALAVNLACIETASAIYDWATSDEEDFLSGGELDLYDGRTVANVTNLTLTEVGFKGPDGNLISAVDLTWTPVTDAFVELYKVRYNKTGTTNYFYASSREPRVYISGLDITSNYDFRVQAENLIGVSSTGTTLSNQALNGDTTAPSAPTSGSATGGIQTITAEWTNPSDIDFKHVEVFVNTSDSIPANPTSIVDGEEYIVSGLSGAVTRYFWLKSVDFSGNKSAATSSFNATSVVAGSSDIADDAIGSDQIADGAVTTTTIADDAITTPKIVANAITANEIASDTITATQIAAGAINTDELAANSVNADKIQVNSITANKISGDISEVFNLSKFVYPYHAVPALVADTFTEFVVPAPDISITKYASLLGKIKYQASSNLDACLLVMEFQRKSAGTTSGVSIGAIAGSGTTGQPYTHYVEVSGNHTKEIDVYGGIATSQTSPSFVASPSSVEFDGSTNRTRIIYGNPSPSTPTFTSGTLYYNEDRWLSSGTWLGDAAGAQRFPIPAIGTTALQTLPLTQALAKSDSQEEYRIRVYSQSLSTGTLSLSAIDTQIILST